MKEVIMKVPSFSADYPKAPIYVAELVRCGECIYWKNSLCQAWHRVIPKDGYCSIGERDGSTQTKTQNSNLTFEKDECAKEYEELGLKELKELIDADRKTEATISKMQQVDKDINVRSKWETPPKFEHKGFTTTCVSVPMALANDDKCFDCNDFFTCDGQCDEVEDEPQTNHLVKTPSKSRDGHEIADAPLTDAEITELAKEIVHKMIDNSVIAEDAYPDLRQRMHEAVERLGEYYSSENERSE